MAHGDAVLAQYEELIVNQASRISSVESALRTLSWILPGRFQDAELASEGLYSAMNVLGIYHDSILQRTLSSLPASARPPSSSHSRYTRHWQTTSPPYKHLARLLTILSYSELLLEMSVRKRKGPVAAGNTVLGIEGIKAVLRLWLFLKTTKGRPLVSTLVPEREIDPSVLEMHRDNFHPHHKEQSAFVGGPGSVGGAEGAQPATAKYWTGKRTGITRPTLSLLHSKSGDPAAGDPTASVAQGKLALDEYLATRAITAEEARRPVELVSKADRQARVAEIIWILRPLIYTALLRKYGRKHTLPFLLSLAMEYMSYSLRSSSMSARTTQAAMGVGAPPSGLEKDELAGRAKGMWWYFLRGPVWESWTRPQVTAFTSKLENVPVLGALTTLVSDYVPLIDDYYYYTSS